MGVAVWAEAKEPSDAGGAVVVAGVDATKGAGTAGAPVLTGDASGTADAAWALSVGVAPEAAVAGCAAASETKLTVLPCSASWSGSEFASPGVNVPAV